MTPTEKDALALDVLGDRFWRKVSKIDGGCWLWTASVSQSGAGYGQYTVAKKRFAAHRLVYSCLHGEIPEGMEICHTCDVKRCVNPAHLFMGTKSDNMRDCARKGRNIMQRRPDLSVFNGGRIRPLGEQNVHAKLTAQHVREILALTRSGESPSKVADYYGVTASHVRRLVSRKAWAHLDAARGGE